MNPQTKNKTQSLNDLFFSIMNPSPLSMSFPTKTANTTPATMFPSSAQAPMKISMQGTPQAPVIPPKANAPAPVVKSSSAGPIFAGANAPASPAGPVNQNPAAPVAQNQGSAVPPQWVKPDGSFYTPDEIASGIAAKMSASGDVGNMARKDLSTGKPTVEQLSTDVRNINNVRNDIAVGESDPYEVASNSGIAYTPAQLKAIESAYAGVYDPEINSVFAKLEATQKSADAAASAKAEEAKLRLQAQLQASAEANKPYTLGKDEIRYDAQGNPIAMGISSTTSTTGAYTPGANADVDAWISGIKAGTYKASDVPKELASLVAQGMAQSQANAPISAASNNAISNINKLLEDTSLLGQISGVPNVKSFFPGTESQTLKNVAKQLAGILALDNRNQLKGQGAISDFEFKVLGDASSALGIDKDSGRTNLSDTQFIEQLQKLKTKLEVGHVSIPDDEVQVLIDNNFTPEQIRAQYGTGGAPKTSFNSAGNASASTLRDAIVTQESGGKYTAVNKDSGALGKYQIMPSNLKNLVGLSDTPENRNKFLSSPELQDMAFDNLLGELNKTYNGDTRKMLAAYYGGGGAARIVGTPAADKPQGKYPSINQYVSQILGRLNTA